MLSLSLVVFGGLVLLLGSLALLVVCSGINDRFDEQTPRSLRRNGLPVQLIERALVMRHAHLAGAPGELLEAAETAPRSHSILPHPPKAFDRVEVVATRGGEEMEAQRIAGVVEGCGKLVRPVHPAALDDHDDLLLDFLDRIGNCIFRSLEVPVMSG